MLVYRICLEKWSHALTASGFAARWNSKGRYIIYTAGSRSLACLENIVHRSGEGLNDKFKILTIDIPSKIKIAEIKESELDKDWSEYSNYSYCRKLGDAWIIKCDTLILKVPSAIIPEESNFLINPNHPDFKFISIKKVEDFKFDQRIK